MHGIIEGGGVADGLGIEHRDVGKRSRTENGAIRNPTRLASEVILRPGSPHRAAIAVGHEAEKNRDGALSYVRAKLAIPGELSAIRYLSRNGLRGDQW
jgi:hypothetical protein